MGLFLSRSERQKSIAEIERRHVDGRYERAIGIITLFYHWSWLSLLSLEYFTEKDKWTPLLLRMHRCDLTNSGACFIRTLRESRYQ